VGDAIRFHMFATLTFYNRLAKRSNFILFPSIQIRERIQAPKKNPEYHQGGSSEWKSYLGRGSAYVYPGQGLFIGVGCNPIPYYIAMTQQPIQEAGKKFTVFEIENVNKKSKNYKRKIFISSSSMTEETILSRIRSMQDSKTGRGGTKDLSKDIKSAGEEYPEKFKVRVVKGNLSRERAEEVKASLIDRHSKVYNQSERVF